MYHLVKELLFINNQMSDMMKNLTNVVPGIKVQLKLRVVSKKNNNGHIYVLFYLKRQQVTFSTKVCVNKNDWNATKYRVKSKDVNYKDKNLILEQILARINNIFVKARLRDRTLDKDRFMQAYLSPNDFENFLDYCDRRLQENLDLLQKKTVQGHNNIMGKLREFKDPIYFDELDTEFVLRYRSYLQKVCEYHPTTVYKHLTILKKHVHLAIRDGYMDVDPFLKVKIPRGKNTSVFLTVEEFEQIINLYYEDDFIVEHERLVLRFFMYMALGSQHISDAKAMRIEDLQGDSFVYYRKKMRYSKPEPITVPISSFLREIINKQAAGRKKGLLWEKMLSDQKINMYLKIIAARAGIDKPITAKVGRHTFATYYLSKTKDIYSLKDIMGHSSINQTLIYAHALQNDKEQGIKCFDALLKD